MTHFLSHAFFSSHVTRSSSPLCLAKSSFKFNSSSIQKPPLSATVPARDRVIDFGKHKGKMLGTLPSNYLKWVSKNLRARDFEEWANLADQVLLDPVYKDRMEWEFAENLLNGNNNCSSRNESVVSELLEISDRFGWDNKDKVGWSKVKFELLGTSKGGRIPRASKTSEKERHLDAKEGELKVEVSSRGEERRRARRERQRMKTEVVKEEKLGIKEESRGGFGNRIYGKSPRDEGIRTHMETTSDKDPTVDNYNPFPGREALLKKVIFPRETSPQVPTKDFEAALFVFDEETRHELVGVSGSCCYRISLIVLKKAMRLNNTHSMAYYQHCFQQTVETGEWGQLYSFVHVACHVDVTSSMILYFHLSFF